MRERLSPGAWVFGGFRATGSRASSCAAISSRGELLDLLSRVRADVHSSDPSRHRSSFRKLDKRRHQYSGRNRAALLHTARRLFRMPRHFSRLIRGEMIERSIHFYLLSPVRRELQLLAKFAAGSMQPSCCSRAQFSRISCWCMWIRRRRQRLHLQRSRSRPDGVVPGHYRSRMPGLWSCLPAPQHDVPQSNARSHARAWMGGDQPNPSFPAAELSVASYLRHLMPVQGWRRGNLRSSHGQTEPVPAWQATLGLMALIAVVLFYSCLRIRKLEIATPQTERSYCIPFPQIRRLNTDRPAFCLS